MDVKLINITPDAERLIAYCARVSSPNQDNPEYEKLLRYCMNHGHFSVFEMADMTVEITTSRAIAAQILRHKSFSFQEFCISGDSLITTVSELGKTKKIPIKKLYEYQSDPRMQSVWKRGVRVYDERSKSFKRALVKEVFKTGIKPVYEVTLSDGKKIKSTLEHKFLSKEGFTPLNNLSVGDFIGVNGIPVYQSKDWMVESKSESIQNGTGVQGIADKAGCSYHTIRKWLKVHGIQFTKNEVATYAKVWNKGLPSKLQPNYGNNVSDESRQKMRDSARKGVDSNLYTNGNSSFRSFRQSVYDWQNKYKKAILSKYQGECVYCHNKEELQIDHVMPVSLYPELAFDVNNLQILCKPCHRKKSIKETTIAKQTCTWKRIESIEYVGEEQTYDMEVNHESHNYIANGIVVHNSQRYSPVTEFETIQARRQDKKNRQNSFDDLDDIDKAWFLSAQAKVINEANNVYRDALNRGIAKECARMVLPLLTQTRLYMKGSIRSWIHYLQVRCGDDTQKEHREIAMLIKALMSTHLPTIGSLIN